MAVGVSVKRLLLAWIGLWLWASPCFAAGSISEFDAGGARYRMWRHEPGFGRADYEIALTRSSDHLLPPGGTGTDRDRRCDAFAEVLATLLLPANRGESFVRREVVHNNETHEAQYWTFHQGYLVENDGGLNIKLDDRNRIVGASFSIYASRPPLFRLKSDAELDSIARASVPLPIREVLHRSRHIASQDSVSRPVFLLQFLVTTSLPMWWEVRVDAETGVAFISEPRFPGDYEGPRTW